MVTTLQKHLRDLKKFNDQRIFWLKLSGFVVIVVLMSILDWALLGKNDLYWYLVSAGLALSVIWWYWTMMLLRHILQHRVDETEILSSILNDIREIKEEVKKLDHNA